MLEPDAALPLAKLIAEGNENCLESHDAPSQRIRETGDVFQRAQGALVSRHKNETGLGRRRKDLGLSGIRWDRRQLIEPEIARLHCHGHRLATGMRASQTFSPKTFRSLPRRSMYGRAGNLPHSCRSAPAGGSHHEVLLPPKACRRRPYQATRASGSGSPYTQRSKAIGFVGGVEVDMTLQLLTELPPRTRAAVKRIYCHRRDCVFARARCPREDYALASAPLACSICDARLARSLKSTASTCGTESSPTSTRVA